jgi:hypothetical protein
LNLTDPTPLEELSSIDIAGRGDLVGSAADATSAHPTERLFALVYLEPRRLLKFVAGPV